MSLCFKSVQKIVWAACLMSGSAFAQSSLPLISGKVIVDKIDLASSKKIPLPEGRWVVMGLHTRETPLTGGSRTSQTVEFVSLMNEDDKAPIQYLSMAWTLNADVNWTGQPCDNYDHIKNRPFKNTFGTNTSSLIVKCSASFFNLKFGDLNSVSILNSAAPLRKSLWLPIAQNSRIKPTSALDLFGFISKNRNDFVEWHAYINPEYYGLDQTSDTQYKTPIDNRQTIADNLLRYAMAWNAQYLQLIEKIFFPVLFQSASGPVGKFNFSERVNPMKLASGGSSSITFNPQPSAITAPQSGVSSEDIASNVEAELKKQQSSTLKVSNFPPCAEKTIKHNCTGMLKFSENEAYFGEFRDGKAHGMGFYVIPKRGEKYEGEFSNNKFHGQGVYFFRDGSKYTGNFNQNESQGVGTYTTPNGSAHSVSFRFNRLPLLSLNVYGYNDTNSILDQNITERDRLTAELEAAQRRQQELEKQLGIERQRDAAGQVPTLTVNTNISSAHALVIGNSAYPGSARLNNAVNDADAISQKLRSMGFTVTTVTDANRQKLVQSLSTFRRTAASADLSLFFYAGHGVQIFGTNYILPTDVDQSDPAQATIQGVSLNNIVESFLPGKIKLVFLDACRDNPLQRSGDRGISKGLAPISVAQGTLIAYATKDGFTASDGVGQRNSPFTKALLDHLSDPADIGVVLRRVREKVMLATGGKQQPWDYGSLTGGELVLAALKGRR